MKALDLIRAQEEALSSLRECCREVSGIPVVSIIATIRGGKVSYSVTGPAGMSNVDVYGVLRFVATAMETPPGEDS